MGLKLDGFPLDDFLFFFPAGGEALGPSEPEGDGPGVAAARELGCEEAAAHGRAAHLPLRGGRGASRGRGDWRGSDFRG